MSRKRQVVQEELQPLPVVEEAPPVVALFYGQLLTGEPCAAELELRGLEVAGGTVLYVGRPEVAARAWEASAYARLSLRREYSEAERRASATQGRGVLVAQVGTGYAMALERRGSTTAAVVLEVEEGRPHSPKVVVTGDRLSCWHALHSWALRHVFPRGYR